MQDPFCFDCNPWQSLMSWHPVESVDDSDNPELELSRACDGWSLQFCRDKVYHKLEEAKFLLRTRWVCCQKPGRRQALSQLLLQGSTSEKTTMKCLESPLWPHSLRLRRPEPKCLFALVFRTGEEPVPPGRHCCFCAKYERRSRLG